MSVHVIFLEYHAIEWSICRRIQHQQVFFLVFLVFSWLTVAVRGISPKGRNLASKKKSVPTPMSIFINAKQMISINTKQCRANSVKKFIIKLQEAGISVRKS